LSICQISSKYQGSSTPKDIELTIRKEDIIVGQERQKNIRQNIFKTIVTAFTIKHIIQGYIKPFDVFVGVFILSIALRMINCSSFVLDLQSIIHLLI